MMALAVASALAASAALVDEDTLVYVTFDGTVGEAAATGANMNLVASGPTAQLVTVNSAPAATYAAGVSARIGDCMAGTTPRGNASSLHTITNGVSTGTANGKDGGTALMVAATNFFSGSFTLEMYFCTDGQIDATTAGGRPNLLFNGSTYYTQLTFDGNAKLMLVFYEDDNGTPKWRNPTIGDAHAYDDGLWHHVAIVYDSTASRLSVWIDHEQIMDRPNCIFVPDTVARPLYVGGRSDVKLRFLNGWMDEFRYTTRALGESEFLAMYGEDLSLKVIRPDTLVYVPFDGESGSVVETGRNLNAVPGGVQAALVRSGDADAALWSSDDMPALGIRDGKTFNYDENPSYAVFSTNAANNGATVKVAAAKYFDGTSFTAEMFFKTSGRIDSSATYDMPNLIDAFHSGLAVAYIQMTFNKTDGKLYAVYNNDGVWAGGTFGAAHAYDDGEWHHLACVYDSGASTYRVFVDGTNMFERSGVTIGSSDTAVEAIVIGGRLGASGYTRFFDGAVDAFRFTKAALAPDDFLRRSNGIRGLILHFR